ncbi:CBS domain-containing protein [Streptomyces sp. SID11385]|uniref:CBS domain-containing protein n=1 Tax=Streptomyces sp. SID11385 TaxID=2706031 RepID=UPI001EF37881|nr:CBS domain-containing protein [Streptomyces sp. SID11385]
MTVEVALSLMAAARTRHLVICDEDGRPTGHVTRARLTTVCGSPGYTDRTRLRDIQDGVGFEAGRPARPDDRPSAADSDENDVRGALAAPTEQRPRSARPSVPAREATCAASSPASRST